MAGMSTKVQGEIFEGNLDELLHEEYKKQGKALVWKAGTVAVMRGKAWRPVKSLPDFQGVFGLPDTLRGSFVSFDAKSVGGETYSHSKERIHQCRHLLEVQASGGIAFLLIHRLDDDSGWLLWPQQHWNLNRGWTVHLTDALPMAIGCRVPKWEGAWEYIPDWHRAVTGGKR